MHKKKWKKTMHGTLSAALAASLLVPGFPLPTKAATKAADLIISEYVEGGSYNKAIELYNGTGASVDLSTYTLELHSNGAVASTGKVNLTGTLASNDTYVIYHKDAAQPIKDQGDLEGTAAVNFNGDDPVVLRNNGAVVDSIGQADGLKHRFGTDVTLVRKSSVQSGDMNIVDAFDAAAEWDSYSKDTFSNLGSHEMDGSAASEPTESVEVASAFITGTPKVGETLTAKANDGATNVKYQWQAADAADGAYTNIEGATDNTLKLTASQEGKFIKVVIRGDNESQAASEATEQVAAADPVQAMAIAEARTKSAGETVTIKGIVTAKLKNTIAVEDETGGIAVRPASLDVTVGDQVTLLGTIADFRGLLQVDPATIVEKTAGAGTPASKEVTGADVKEDNESELVTVKNVKIKSVHDGGSWANYTATDGTTEFIVRDETGELDLTEGMAYDSITGIVQQYNKDYQIIPRSQQDIVADSSVVQPVFASPGSGIFAGGTTVTLSTNTANAEILYTTDGSDPAAHGVKYEAPIEMKENTTLKAVVKTADGQYSEAKTFDYKITDSLQIHDVQGASHASPLNGQTVENLQGVVTYSFKLGSSYYYHIQTPDEQVDRDPKTSEGIVLYSGKNPWPIREGDLVSVTGKVSEYAIDGFSDRQKTDLKTTQINVRNDQGGEVDVVEKGVELPDPIVIDERNLPADKIDSDQLEKFNPDTDAIDFWESLEGMRVQVGNVKAVAPQEHGDLVTVLESSETNSLHGGVLLEENDQNAERIQFRLEPNRSARDFEVATGDQFKGPIEGVVGYSFQNYKIYVELDKMEAAHVKGEAKPEQTTIAKDEKKLTIASYNLENFSNNDKTTSNEKAQKLARAIAADMQSPDIVGVTEVQDNNGPDGGDSKADQSYQRLIKAIADAGGPDYQYVNIDPVNDQDGGQPGANIRVGFLYNPDRVSLTKGRPAGEATTAVGYENGKLTYNPGRIAPTNEAFNSSRKPLAAQFDFQGENVIVIANHWNSKGGDTPLFGLQQPPVYKSEEQRKKIAKVVTNFIKEIKTENPDANIVSLGDFNDFQFSDALKIHEGEHMTNMIHKVEERDRYTYVYQGNSQVLDHILVSNNLAAHTKVDILHINADFTDMAGRASDHDPVLVQVDLKGAGKGTPELVKPEKAFNLANLKTKKLTIQSPSVAIHLDESSVLTEGLYLTGAYAELKGAGLKTAKVIIQPKAPGAIIDFKGAEAREVIIFGTNVKEIRGAENIMNKIQYENGAAPGSIQFTDSEGEPIGSPSVPEGNKAPVLQKELTNQTVKAGETLSLSLTNYFLILIVTL
ncbi:lamin tail domain-containing protein [Bacillus xiapuensis]|uniref:lamin tail domain-containing protein n=1 Tax=Bacillus xiapuensis TaxID=2014075 RepID=UPI001E2832D5|nr:chitobiase/beta-hexosaminidase C-terminal domain-containing protein [Bacillus xiapuensis]